MMRILLLPFLLFLTFSACVKSPNESPVSSSDKAWEMIHGGALVVDVRSAEEFSAGHVDGALNIPHSEIERHLSELGTDKGRPIVLYCGSGRRAGIAETALRNEGFTNTLNAGGFSELERALAAHKND